MKTVDARGMACPLPVLSAKKAVEELSAPEEIEVLVDNEIASQNVMKYARQKGITCQCEQISAQEYHVRLTVTQMRGDTAEADAQSETIVCESCSPVKKKIAVVLSANQMGSGDEKLGRTLMKAFVFALTKQDVLPDVVLLYNSGAYLSCEGSESLEDLRALEEAGVQIMTCGTCLDFYGLKEKLAVGSVSNMYEIVAEMEQADSVVRP